MQKSVAIVGIGLLGSAMARRLLRAGCRVSGFDVSASGVQALQQWGGEPRSSLQELCVGSEAIVLCLPNSQVVADVLQAITPNLHKQQIVVDMTTGDPDRMRDFGHSMAGQGLVYVEANVAGSSEQAEQGQATLFLGGDSPDLAQLRWLWPLLTSQAVHIGPVGTASKFKLVHNLILGLNRAVLAEGLLFAESLGFDLLKTLEILKQTPAFSQVMQTKGGKMALKDWSAQAKVSQHLKDVELVLHQAKQSGFSPPLTRLHRQLLEQAVALGLGESDNASIIEAIRVASGAGARVDKIATQEPR